jgi:hypothetical protein
VLAGSSSSASLRTEGRGGGASLQSTPDGGERPVEAWVVEEGSVAGEMGSKVSGGGLAVRPRDPGGFGREGVVGAVVAAVVFVAREADGGGW